MMYPAARPGRPGREKARTMSFQAPTGGWNARDALADMGASDAVVMDNFFPATDAVYLRTGSAGFAYHAGQLTAFARAGGATYFDASGVLQTAASDVPRYSYYDKLLATHYTVPQLQVEAAVTNYCLWNRDLTNAAWAKSSATALKNQTGIDGVSNSASKLTATAANGKATQAVTCAAGGTFLVYLKRITGSGDIELTVDGSAWASVQTSVGTAWEAVTLSGAGLNPTVGIRLATGGDAVAVDHAQVEVGGTSFPVATTTVAVTTAPDVPTYGSGSSATVVGPSVDTLISYASGAATKLLAAAGGCLYDASQGGVVPLPLATGFASDRWQYLNMNGYALLFNGSDTPQKYDGTVVTANTITGMTPANLIYPCLFKHRVFMIEKDTMNAWYLGTDAISGAASKLDFSLLCPLGGSLVAMGTWTRDGGVGPDDFAVFLTSRGEAVLYQGTDPANADTWALVGVFRIGAPVGQRPLFKAGADLIVISEDGFLPLSKVLPIDRVGAEKVSISDKIRTAVASATASYKDNFGWEGCLYPQGNWGVFNVPVVEHQTSHQYVINTLNNSWCRFTGMNANCWAVYGERLYFGTQNGVIALADTGEGDFNGGTTSTALVAIQADLKTSFQYFQSRSRLKQFRMVRPVISANGSVDLALAVCVDYEDMQPSTVLTPAITGAVWDVATWDVTPWSTGNLIRKFWLAVSGNGYSAALRVRSNTNGVAYSIASIDWLFEQGGVM